MSDSTTALRLPLPSDATVEGPILTLRGDKLSVRYDHQDPNGRVDWVSVCFRGVLVFEYRQFAACEGEHITGFREIVRLLDSPWLNARLRAWSEPGASSQAQPPNEPKEIHHLRLYFDDVGCIDVACEEVMLGEES